MARVGGPNPLAAEQPIPPGFLERARREAARYGDDPWILLRELVQNSRDAGAAHIAFTAQSDDALDELSCRDDGRGMTRAEMRRYLLRLYASGKAAPREQTREERARGPVGRFGVGFWSVLRFSPSLVRVESRSGDEGTAFEVDCARGVLREVPCGLSRRGTRVTLWRPTTGEPFANAAEERLVHWAGPVRGLAGGPLPTLTFNGVPRNPPLTEPELIAERIVGRGFDGVLGFGRAPSVALYAHGLLLREVSSLEELLPRRSTRAVAGAPGLYPVVRVNADGLEVLMNRQEVVEDRLLEDIVKTCERRLRRLQRQLLDRLARLRLIDRLRVATPRLTPVVVVVGVLLGAGAAGYTLAGSAAPSSGVVVKGVQAAPASAPRPPRSTTDLQVGAAPRIDQPSLQAADEAWDLRVSAPDDSTHLLKLTTLSRFEAFAGLLSEPPVEGRAHAWGERTEESLALDVGLHGARSLARLPVPSGHGVVRGSALVDGKRATVLGGADGEPLVRLRGPAERVRYSTGPSRDASTRPSLLTAPSSWPPKAAALLARAERLPPEERVRAIETFVKRELRYTNSLEDAVRLDAAQGSFVERALAVEAGDCDVMNVLFALLLRAAGVPARVAVGLVVNGEEVAPDLHAWSEYFVMGEWRSLDVSPPLPMAGGGPAHAHAHSHWHTHLPPRSDSASPTPPHSPPLAAERAPSTSDDLPMDAMAPAPAVAAPEPAPEPGTVATSAPSTTSAPRQTPSGMLLVAGGLMALALVGGLVLLGRRVKPRAGDDEALATLLERWLQGARGSDPLHLRLRPFFPLVGRRRRRSLAELEQRSARGLLFAATPQDPLVPSLRRSAALLDVSRPAVAKLLPNLPEAPRLDALSAALSHDDADPLLQEVEATLRQIDDGVRVLSLPRASGVHELELPTRGGLAPRYLLVGEADPEWRRLVSAEPLPPARLALAVRYVLARTTLYRAQRSEILRHIPVTGEGLP